jgi:hypothetical protein
MTSLSGKEFNDKYPNTVFYTVLHRNNKHNNVTLLHGLNVDSSVKFYFWEINNLHLNIPNRSYIATITIPQDAFIYIGEDFSTNQIILDLNNKVSVCEFYDWGDNQVCKKIISKNGDLLRYVKNQTEEICIMAVIERNFFDTLKWVKNQTNSICEAAVTRNGHALQFVKHQTDYICELAVQQDGYALVYVRNKTAKICRLAEISKITR